MRKRIFKLLYVLVRWPSLFDLPYFNKIKNWIYSQHFKAPGIKVLRNVLFSCSHPCKLSKIVLGSNVEIGSFSHLDYSGGLEIGSDLTISEGTKIYTHNHTVEDADVSWRDQKTSYLPLVIEDGCWIGTNALILGSAKRIGRGAIVAAGSVVTKEVPPMAIVAGNPAKVIRFRVSKQLSAAKLSRPSK